jgi:hypothetical protein
MSLNRSQLFKAAHWKAKNVVINTRGTKYARTYAQAFSEALKHEYAKLRQAAERQAMRDEQNISAPIRSFRNERAFFGGSRAISAVGA